ncbi:hypothetical protein V8F33_002569 [Rhypophila sp. PSN 637]
MALDIDVIVAIAIGVPSCLITLLSLWVAYLTFTVSRQPLTHLHFGCPPIVFPGSRDINQDIRSGRSRSAGHHHFRDTPSFPKTLWE